jgi:hypothetical protein
MTVGGWVKEARVLEETQETEEIIERVAALDIGKAEVVCWVRVPHPDSVGGERRRSGRTRLVRDSYATRTRR